MSRTSIIIPTFNGRSFLQECLYAIKKYTTPPYEVIVVDNGSTDGTEDICLREEVLYVSVPNRLGFPAACNVGMRVASGNELLLLNNDVLVTPRWLDNMLACLYAEAGTGIVGPMTDYASGKQQVKLEYTDLFEAAERFNQPNPAKWMTVERIVGLCFLFRRELLERIGYLDESFSPGHYEDDDYCYRARLAGYTLKIAGDVFVRHHGSATFGKEEEARVRRLIETNRQRFIDKWGVDPNSFI